MRLLNTRTLQLQEFFNEPQNKPDYVILSHTWGKEEVTLDDMRNGTAKQRRGFAKLQFTCQQALKDGYGYAWIDTCCIDKSSSSELSEAINSMFQWYRVSKVCYAYLEDVSVEDMENCRIPDDHHMLPGEERALYESKFAQSRWFKRGWTLQELIAPSYIKFYSGNWDYLGSLSNLLNVIVMITGITDKVLHSEDSIKMEYLGRASIAQRMSWAATRKTTRIEDEAYCLMGIFGVNIPLLYGEGRAAFIRLQEEIIRTSTDQSIFAWKSTGPERTQLLAPNPSCFQHSGTVIQLKQQSRLESFSMTSLGLSIRMPIYRDLDRYAGILTCRHGNNLCGPIALQLTHARTDEYGVEFFYISESHSRERATIFYLVRAPFDIPPKKPIILLRQPPSVSIYQTQLNFDIDKLERTNTFVIEHRPFLWPNVGIREFYPSRHWAIGKFKDSEFSNGLSRQQHILSLPDHLNIAAVLLYYKEFPIIVTFGLQKGNWEREVFPWIAIHEAKLPVNLRAVVDKEKTLLESRTASRASLYKFPDEYLNMQIVRATIMDELVFLIELSVEPDRTRWTPPPWWRPLNT